MANNNNTTLRSLLEHAEGYGEQHKMLAQVMMFRRSVELERVPELFHEICEKTEGLNVPKEMPSFTQRQCQQLLNVLLPACNERLPRVGFRLVVVADERDADKEWLVLTSEQHFSKPFAEYAVCDLSADELALFRFWLRLMFTPAEEEGDEGNGSLLITQALNAAKKEGATPYLANRLLTKLQAKKWIELEDDIMVLHPCAIGELETVLQVEFELPVCALCNHPILMRKHSAECPNGDNCEANYHAICLQKQTFPMKCAKCKKEIDETILEKFTE